MTRPGNLARSKGRSIVRALFLLAIGLALTASVAGCFLLPNVPPAIDAQVDPASGHAPLRVQLDASASTDPDGIIVGCHWTFEDGTTARGVNAEHTFTAPGTYVVDLTLRDDDGAEATTTIEVRVEPPNAAPTALFMVTPVAAVVGEPIRFDATVSQDPDGSVVAYAWDFGDGATAASPQADHAYATEGTYSSSSRDAGVRRSRPLPPLRPQSTPEDTFSSTPPPPTPREARSSPLRGSSATAARQRGGSQATPTQRRGPTPLR